MYHIVCPVKYKKIIFKTDDIDAELKNICIEISNRYEIEFIKIGADKDHVHFLVQTIPRYSPSEIVKTIKSITAREMFKKFPQIKKELLGGEFWSKGYFINILSQHSSEEVIRKYVANQGKNNKYKTVYKNIQLSLLD